MLLIVETLYCLGRTSSLVFFLQILVNRNQNKSGDWLTTLQTRLFSVLLVQWGILNLKGGLFMQ